MDVVRLERRPRLAGRARRSPSATSTASTAGTRRWSRGRGGRAAARRAPRSCSPSTRIPRAWWRRTRAPAALMTLDQKAEALARARRRPRWPCCPSRPSVAAAGPGEFARRVLRGALDAAAVVVGDNFRFGRGRAGDAALTAGARSASTSSRCAPVLHAGAPISSSRDPPALARGRRRAGGRAAGPAVPRRRPASCAARAAGARSASPPRTSSRVNETLPALGVYAAGPGRSAGGRAHPAVVNVGRRPTFGAGAASPSRPTCLDFDRRPLRPRRSRLVLRGPDPRRGEVPRPRRARGPHPRGHRRRAAGARDARAGLRVGCVIVATSAFPGV